MTRAFRLAFAGLLLSLTAAAPSQRAAVVLSGPQAVPSLGLNLLLGALPNGATFARASGATCTDATGTLQTLAVNAPCFDRSSTGAALGLRIEEVRTNLILWSNPGAHWTSNAAPNDSTATAAAAASPDGGVNATKITPSTNTGVKAIFTTFAGAPSTTYVASTYLKAAGYRYALVTLGSIGFGANAQTVVFDLQTGTIGQQSAGATGLISPAGNGWYRCVVVATSPSGAVAPYVLSTGIANPGFPGTGAGVTFAGDGTSGIYEWGAQVEAAAFAESLIQTSGATATRAADIVSMPLTVPAGSNVSMATQAIYEAVGVASAGMAQLDDTTANNRMLLYSTSGTGAAMMALTSGGASTVRTGAVLSAGVVAKLAGAWTGGSSTLVVNGGAPITGASGAVPRMTTLRLSTNTTGTAILNGWLQSIRVWNRLLSASEMQGVTR